MILSSLQSLTVATGSKDMNLKMLYEEQNKPVSYMSNAIKQYLQHAIAGIENQHNTPSIHKGLSTT